MTTDSSRKSVDRLEMDDKSKKFRKRLMDLSPTVGVGKNDLFNLGYGGGITLLFCAGFVITFFYFAISDSLYNKTAKFLVPHDGEIKGDMYCTKVSLSLTDTYVIDSSGRWKSDTEYCSGSSLYGLEMVNSQYKSNNDYKTQLTRFSDDLHTQSASSTTNDYAWNLVFGGSYAVVEKVGGGKSTLFVDADSRLMYKAEVIMGAFATAEGTCIPESSSFSYDGINFVFDITLSSGTGTLCPGLTDSALLEYSLGLYNVNSPAALPTIAPTVNPSIAATPTPDPTLHPAVAPVIPSVAPTASMPSLLPSKVPTVEPTSNTANCPAYSATNTNNDNQNTASCTFTVCDGDTIILDACGCTGDTYLRLYNESLVQVAYDDDGCGGGSHCSKITYSITGSECQSFYIAEGCFSSGSCSATVTIAESVSSNAVLHHSVANSLGQISLLNTPTVEPTVEPSFTPISVSLKFDTAAITTAIAINYGIASVDSLDKVPSLNGYAYLTAYTDSSYAPMQPVYCFDPSDFGYYGYTLCLLKMGEVFVYPITSHYGNYGYATGDDLFIPEACDCDYILDQDWCQIYDIDIGLIFIPSNYYTDTISAILEIQDSAKVNHVNIQTFVRPFLASSVEAAYYTTPGEALTYYDALDSLSNQFDNICPDCYMIAFELFDNDHYFTGPTINKGGLVIRDMACTNVFYNADVLDTMTNAPPSAIVEPYLVCTDSNSKAVTSGISSAYASAGLYTSVMLIVLMFLVKRYHKYYHKDNELTSVEQKEVLVRNATANVLEYLLRKQDLPDEDREYLTSQVEIIGITDPLTHAERPDQLKHMASLFALSMKDSMKSSSGKSSPRGSKKSGGPEYQMAESDTEGAAGGMEMTPTDSLSPDAQMTEGDGVTDNWRVFM